MNAATKITISKFDDGGHAGDTALALIYADGKCVGEIQRYAGRLVGSGSCGSWFVAGYFAQIWSHDPGNNPSFCEYVRDGRGHQLQTPAQAKREIKRQIAEYLNA